MILPQITFIIMKIRSYSFLVEIDEFELVDFATKILDQKPLHLALRIGFTQYLEGVRSLQTPLDVLICERLKNFGSLAVNR